MHRSTEWIARAVRGTHHGEETLVVGPVVTDSREAGPGSLYIARRGETSDGHDYVAAARRAGAVAVVVEKAVPLDEADGLAQIVVDDSTRALGLLARAHLDDLRDRGPLDVIAVTGSAGKTTTKDLLLQILSADAPTVAPRLSYNNEVGMPLTVLSCDETTRHLVLEMGASGPGHISYLTSIAAPDAAIELMVGHAHLGGFGSVEGIAEAKAELIRGSRPGAPAILNADDPNVLAMAPLATGPVVLFSAGGRSDADVRAEDVDIDGSGHAAFTVIAPEGSAPIRLGLVGAHHVHNALAAIAGARALGMGLPRIVDALNAATALSPHRMDVRDLVVDGTALTLIDDSYNANIDSMRAALDALAAIGRGRPRIAVLGEMLELGPTSPDAHREVGRIAAAAGVSTLIALGDDAPHYLDGAGPSVTGICAAGVDEAVAALLDALADGCAVLVKGSYGSHSWRVADALQDRGARR
ncbi:UDP-N-acetylmuramoyl-tripeptide--D-alanyl-D-alanine ligase [Actinomyces sp. B33]|uniref:UDP-N-acetylmuramoyl-tripeptide--D-alanyl-D- alanine ligase n=1 Tax=Actinomyces sp. B33 TaxID=2942131 RepID=UPI00234149C2|nr:UDP-N-acetylmuramoyl-tripeptide--D-alanyl-D-alanine ligase [Actinomyces sp. B33]MDC4233078.1 UDP-N-acetylmuramoyl-tripeptide--D-alanyl-D-alanine ligase [Actinomyces sp. B33]